MAKKAAATVAAPVKTRKPNADAEASALLPTRLRPSSLLDTRGIYCGDNLEQRGRRQKYEGRMMKRAHSPILHSSFFLLTSPGHASHDVKVLFN